MSLTLSFAYRYIFGRSRLSAANWVSLLSAFAICLITSAMLIVLSVYNGYVEKILVTYEDLDTELVIAPKDAKVFSLNDEELQSFLSSEKVKTYSCELQERGLLRMPDKELILDVFGIDEAKDELLPRNTIIQEGRMPRKGLTKDRVELALGYAVAMKNGLYLSDQAPSQMISLLFPKRKGLINPLAPATAFRSKVLDVVGIFKLSNSEYNERVYVELSALQKLLDYRNSEVSRINLVPSEGLSFEELSEALPKDYRLLDREAQHPELTYIIKIEGFMVYLILGFILLLSAFNLINGISMLILEKRQELDILRALGMSRRRQERIFSNAGLLVSTIGLVIGLFFGLAFAFLQQKFGLIMTGSYLIPEPLPMKICVKDILLIVVAEGFIYLVIMLFTTRIIKKFY